MALRTKVYWSEQANGVGSRGQVLAFSGMPCARRYPPSHPTRSKHLQGEGQKRDQSFFNGKMKPQTPGCQGKDCGGQPSTNRKLDLTHENFLLVESRGYRRAIKKAQVALQASRLSCQVF